MKLISSADFSRILGEKPNFISSKRGHIHYLARLKLGNRKYYNIETAKKLACKLKLLKSQEYEEVIRKLDEYKP